jgi:hypothetical protein
MKLPFNIKLDCEELKTQHSTQTRTNPYSNQSTTLPLFASKVYDAIKDAEINEDYKTMQKGISWFQKHFTKQYFILLD